LARTGPKNPAGIISGSLHVLPSFEVRTKPVQRSNLGPALYHRKSVPLAILKSTGFQHGSPVSEPITTGSVHALPSKVLDQICTFLAPSASPPNHAAMSLPASCSTSVEAWHDLNGAFSKMNMENSGNAHS